MKMHDKREQFARSVQETLRQLASTDDGKLIQATLATYEIEPVETLRIAINSNTRKLYVNGQWFASQSVTKRGYALAHEMIHDRLGHCRWLTTKPTEHSYEARLAADCAVYSVLLSSMIHEWKGDLDCVSPESFGLPMNMTVDQYFAALVNEKKKRQEEELKQRDQQREDEEDEDDDEEDSETEPSDEADDSFADEGDEDVPAEDDDGGSGDDEIPGECGGDEPCDDGMDDGTVPPSDGSAGESAGAGDLVPVPDGEPVAGQDDGDGEGAGLNCDDLIPDNSPEDESILGHGERAMTEALKAAGVGGSLLSSVLEAKKVERIDWKRQLDRFMELVQDKEDRSYSTPSRRSLWRGVAMPGARNTNEITSACVVLDVSGSVSDSAIESAIGRISDFCVQLGKENFVCHLMQFSDGLKSHTEYTCRDMPLKKLDVVGRGSTYIAEVFAHVEDEKIDPAVMVVITDGDIFDLDSLRRPAYPVLWLIDGDYRGFNPPFGSKVPVF